MYRRFPLPLALLLALATACGSKDSGGGSTPDDVAGDAASDTTDAGADGALDVGGGDDTDPLPDVGGDDVEDDVAPDVPTDPVPTAVRLALSPNRAVFAPGAIVTATATVYDQQGDVLPGIDVAFSSQPAAATSIDGGAFTLLTEGDVVLLGCIDDVCGERRVTVDGGPPTLSLTSPVSGTMLRADEAPTIVVEGVVADARDGVAVFVNGREVDVDDTGAFSTVLTPRFGINHVDVVATDGVTPIEARAGADVLWAPAYHGEPIPDPPDPGDDTGFPDAGDAGMADAGDAGVDTGGFDAGSDASDAGASDASDADPDASPIPPAEPVELRIEDGLVLRLSQRFVDDGEAWILPPGEIVAVTRDLAGIVELLVSEVDIMSLVPDPVVDETALQLSVDNLDLGDVIVTLELVDDGIELYVELPAVTVQTRGALDLSGASLDLTGTVVAALAARGDIVARKASRDDDLYVSVDALELALVDATSAFVSPEADAVFALAEGALFGVIEDLLVDTVSSGFLDQVPALVEDLLVSLDDTIGGAPFVLDTGFFPPIALSFNGDMATLAIDAHQAMTIGVDIDIATDADARYPDARGIPLAVPEDASPSLLSTSRVQGAVRLSLVNGLLYALWDSGVLEIDASDVIPDEFAFLIDAAVISGQLPPIMSAAAPDQSDYPVLLSLGGAVLEIGRGAQRDRLGMYLTAGVQISLADNALALTIEDPPRIQLWLIEAGGPTPIFADPADLEGLIATGIWPLLSEQLGESLAIELPSFDVSAAGDVAPTLSDLTLQLVVDRPIAIRDGFLMLDGALEGVADLSE